MIRAALALAIVVGVVGATRQAHGQPTALRAGEFESGPVEDRAPAIELMTFGIGEVIFEKFGHTAICLRYHDPNRLPVCFNYGVTDFDAGATMVWDFLRGQQQFWVEPSSLGSLVAFYNMEDRNIWSQTLPLTEDEARSIEGQLWSDLEEENRFYIYDHFRDNCTTRIRDMIDDATGGRLRAGSDVAYPLTYRGLGRRGLAGLPSLIALADFVLGRQLDAPITEWEAMFSPDVLRRAVEARFAAPARYVHKREGPPFPTTGSTGRLRMFLVALVFTVPLVLGHRRRGARLAVVWTTIYLGLCGVLVWGLVILSSIPGVRWNEVALVVMPLDLALPFLAPARRRRYAQLRVAGLLLVSALAAIGVLRQPLWIPILTAIMPLGLFALGWPSSRMTAAVAPVTTDEAPQAPASGEALAAELP